MCAACIAWPCAAGARPCLQPETWREIAAVKQSLRAQNFDWVLDVQGLLKSAWMARWTGARVAGPSSDSARERVASALYARRVTVPRELHAVDRCRRLGAAVLGYAIDGPPRFDLARSRRARRGTARPLCGAAGQRQPRDEALGRPNAGSCWSGGSPKPAWRACSSGGAG